MSGDLNLNGKTLTINGDLYHKSGELNINGGTLIVKGDYLIDNYNEDTAYGTGNLVMTKTSDVVRVDGNFVMNSYRTHVSYLSAGTMYIKGDFTQKSNYTSNSTNEEQKLTLTEVKQYLEDFQADEYL